MSDELVNKVKDAANKIRNPDFDWDQHQKPDHRKSIDAARREYLARGPRKMLVKNKRTKALEWVEVTGAITRIDGSGQNQTRTLMRFHRPGVGAQAKWQPGCVPRPDLLENK